MYAVRYAPRLPTKTCIMPPRCDQSSKLNKDTLVRMDQSLEWALCTAGGDKGAGCMSAGLCVGQPAGLHHRILLHVGGGRVKIVTESGAAHGKLTGSYIF